MNQVMEEALFITESKRMCAELGMDPAALPPHTDFLTKEELERKRSEYEEVMDVVNYFVEKTLNLMKGFPILIVITDENANILDMAGDEAIKSTITQLGMNVGLHFEEKVNGTNSILLALKHGHPVQLVGKNHYHQFLHTSACYSAPFQYTDEKQMLGTISIMTALELHHPTLLTMLCNLTDSIERELLLRKKNKQMHVLNQIMIESTRNGIIVTDMEGNITEFNEFAEKLTGIRKSDILSQSVSKIHQAGAYISELLKTGKKFQDIEMIFEQTAQRKRKIVLFDALPIHDENSVLVGGFGQFRDITDSYEAKEEAVKASNAKSEFLSQMSHELRTPLNAILGFAQLLEMEEETPLSQTQLEDVREIIKAGDHLLELINQILDLSRIETNKMQVTLSQVEVSELLDECVSLIQPIAETKKIKLSWEKKSSAVVVNADRTRLKQAVINLLTNAIKYNVEGGSVTINGHMTSSNRFRLSVTDTGHGIDESEILYIFQPFHRLPKHGAIEGTGIGLTITKQIIELMGGKIGVNSKINVGSEFWIELNLDPEFETEDAGNSNGTGAEMPEEPKVNLILYVEDNQANLTLVSRILKNQPNLRLLSAPDAATGIQMAESHRPDLILMDINLPDMSGLEAFKRLQMTDATKHIPVIAISANAMPSDIKKGMELGFMKYLTKPINVSSFMDHIVHVLHTGEENLSNMH